MAQGTTKGVPIDIDPLLAADSDLLVPSQKAIKTYTDTGLSGKVNRSGDSMSGSLLLVANPTAPLEAATKDYVDTLINGIDWKAAANAATVAALPTYNVTGSGQILTGAVNGAIPSATTDGVTLTANQRLLVKNETSTRTPNNGIYVVTQVGNGSLPFILTRSSDANTSALLAEATLSVAAGSTLANTQWHCNPAAIPLVIGTTYITFAQIGTGVYSFSAPLVDTGGVISIPAATTSVDGYLSSTDWTNFNTAYTNRITSLTTTGSSGSSTLISNVLNVPTYTLSGLGGQPLATNLTSLSGLTYASTSFVKMTAAGTFALDTNTYQGALTLTTTGTSGASTLIGNTLNIPQYAGATVGGSTGNIQYNNGTTFAGSNNLFWDNTNTRFGIAQSSPTSRFHLNFNQNSVTQSDANGILLANSTAAIAGTQSISPAIVWQGNGWKTTATAASQDVRFRADVLPIEGTTVPNAAWRLSASLNGGAYTERMGLYTYTGAGGFTYLDVQSGNQGQVRSGTIGAVDKLNAVTQLEAGNTITSGANAYKTTNAGANITPKIGSYSTNTSGTKYLSIDNTNSFVLSAYNASGNIISRAAIDIASLNNTAGAESGDLTFLTQSGGTAMSEKMRIFGGGNVGIGTTTDAGFRLDVNGTTRLNSQSLVNFAPSNTTDNVFKITNTRTGSGTGFEPACLALDNTATANTIPCDIRLGSSNPAGIRIYASNTVLTGTPTGAGLQFYTNASSLPGQVYFDSGANNSAALVFRTAITSGSITERMRIFAGGNVGINVNNTDAGFRLDVNGTARVQSALTTAGGTISSTILSNATQILAGSNTSTNAVYRTTNGGAPTTGQLAVDRGTTSQGDRTLHYDGVTDGLVFGAYNSNVPARTIARAAINITGLVNTANSEGGALAFSTQAGGSAMTEKMRLSASGNLGIGISPVTSLQVNLNNTDFTNTGGTNSHFLMTNPSSTGQNVVSSFIAGVLVAKWRTDYVGNISWVAGSTGAHDFFTGGDFSVGSIKMRIFNGGNVQIATSPVGGANADAGFKLDVQGTARVTGALNFNPTNTAAGTTGNQTINRPSGTVNIAAAGTTVTVTNSLVTTSSIVFATIRTNDATAVIKNVVPATGSFTINLNAAATAETSIGFFVIN